MVFFYWCLCTRYSYMCLDKFSKFHLRKRFNDVFNEKNFLLNRDVMGRLAIL